DMGRSLEGGAIVPVEAGAPNTFCDAIMPPRVLPITFGLLRDRRARALSSRAAEVAEAIRFAWDKHGLVVEPGAAVGLAALQAGKIEPVKESVVVLSGGDVDRALHARIVGKAA